MNDMLRNYNINCKVTKEVRLETTVYKKYVSHLYFW